MNNLFNISGKIIVITGGYGVLGSYISQYLAEQGGLIAVLGRSKKSGEELVEQIKTDGGQAIFCQTDVTDKDTLQDCKRKIIDTFGRIDVLINAAGGNQPGAIISPDQSFFDLDIEAMRKVVELNLFGTVLPTMVFAEEMSAMKQGVILNFSSESSLRPLSRVLGYGVAKAAVNNFTQYMAGELATKFGNGIRINAIAPGFFLTTQNQSLLTNADGSFTDRSRAILGHTPFSRFGVPEDLFGTVHYLISDASRYVTGTVAVVDGGFNAFSI